MPVEAPKKLSEADCRAALESLAPSLNIADLGDWYKVTAAGYRRACGQAHLDVKGRDFRSVLRAAYPSHEWYDWLFSQTSKGFWNDPARQTQFFNWAVPKLGISKMEDWYNVSAKQIDEIGGAGLLQHNDDSLGAALRAAFPLHPWLPWKFSHVPRKFWRDVNNQRAYFLWAADALQLQHPQGWYEISSRQLVALSGGDLLRLYGGSLQEAVISVFPEHQFDREAFYGGDSRFRGHRTAVPPGGTTENEELPD